MSKEKKRCAWPSAELLEYHDKEWGVPVHDDVKLYEHIVLDGAQAGLSWRTIFLRREGYRKAFAGFDPAKVARFSPAKAEKLLQDPGIIRNRLKVNSAIQNARQFLKIQDEFGSFDTFIWRFVDGKPIQNRFRSPNEIPARTLLSDRISKELRDRGFNFVGSTICYAWMQAAGLVNDHMVDCFRWKELQRD